MLHIKQSVTFLICVCVCRKSLPTLNRHRTFDLCKFDKIHFFYLLLYYLGLGRFLDFRIRHYSKIFLVDQLTIKEKCMCIVPQNDVFIPGVNSEMLQNVSLNVYVLTC